MMSFRRLLSSAAGFAALLCCLLLVLTPAPRALAAPLGNALSTDSSAAGPALDSREAVDLFPRDKKPKFPTLEEMKKKFTAPPEGASIFFTGLDRKNINAVKKYAEEHHLTHVGKSYPEGYTNVGQYEGDDKEKRKFQEEFSLLYAEATHGTAYLMMDLKKEPKDDSIFKSVEFKAMKESGKVDKIIWLDIEHKPEDPKKVTKTWWKKE